MSQQVEGYFSGQSQKFKSEAVGHVRERSLSAIKALARTQKPLRPTLSPLERAVKFVPEEKRALVGCA